MHRTSPRLRTRRRSHPPRRSSTILTALPYLLAITLAVLCVLCFIPVARAESPESYGHVIGIDLGTTYSSVGIIKNGTVEIIPNSQGHRTTPSWVSFSPNSDDRLIGDSAKHAFHANPSNTVFDAKRLVGRQFNDPDVQRDIIFLPYNVTERDGKPIIQVMYANEQKFFTPEEISAMMLGKMKETAETYLGDKVTHAIITVPAYFNDAQRQATKNAGRIAGLTVLRIINEPTAAAIAYGLDKRGGESNVLVYDLGGGTFDVSVLSIDDGVFEVLSTAGDTHLGGSDFDNRLTTHLQKLYLRATGTDLSSSPSPQVQGRFKRAAELAKRTLSSQSSVLVEIEGLPLGVDGIGELSETVTRATFEELNADLFSETLNVVARTLKDAGLKKGNIDEIVLVGGSTRIPKVREMLKAYFDGKELHTEINPDEAVACGAAIQAGILSGEEVMGDILVMEITPLSFGIETTGGVMNIMVPRNSVIPTLKKQLFSTAQDNQSKVLIKVFEGERSLTKDNNQLGEFELLGIPPAPRGVPQIEVTFAIDTDGILEVSAIDKATGESRSVTITNEHARLTEIEIDRMILEAEEFAAADEAHRLRIEAMGSLKNYVWDLRSKLSEDDVSGQTISARDKQILLDALTDASTWADGARYETTREEVESRIAAVRAIAQPIISVLRQGQKGEDGAVKEWTKDHAEL